MSIKWTYEWLCADSIVCITHYKLTCTRIKCVQTYLYTSHRITQAEKENNKILKAFRARLVFKHTLPAIEYSRIHPADMQNKRIFQTHYVFCVAYSGFMKDC